MIIYADNAATTKLSDKALKAMLPFFTDNYANPSSAHFLGQKAQDALRWGRFTVAKCLNAGANDKLIFTSGGSEADNQALNSIAQSGLNYNKKHIISSKFEHHAVLYTLEQLKKYGFEIELLDIPEDGIIEPSAVESAIRPDTAGVSIMLANNEIGTVQRIDEIGSICRKAGVLFHTDAVQAVGHIPVDVDNLNVDYLSFSSHKFHGPKGVGGLYVREGASLSSVINGGSQEFGFRAGTENLPGIIGTAVALEEALDNLDYKIAQTTAVRTYIQNEITAIPSVKLNGDPLKRLPGNLNFSFEGVDGDSLRYLLEEKGICASAGSACNSSSSKPSHVLKALGLSDALSKSALRLSFDETLSIQEAVYIISSIKEVLSELWN